MKKSLRLTALVAALMLLCAPLTAFARYATLEFGSRGAEVLKLQKALLSLGYDPGGTDGKFGRGTETAVKAYQSASGLEADGKAGNLTLTRLYESGSGSQSGGNQSGLSPSTLKYGDSGSRVSELQKNLKTLGYYTGSVDGRFGVGTQRGVVAFQRASGLKADGLAGSKTLALLAQKASGSSGSGGSSGSSGSSSGTGAAFTRTLRRGMTGQDVTAAQTRLKALGYYTGSVDGNYGSGSILAIKAFQRANSLKADGLTGQQTWNRLMSASAVSAPGAGNSGSSGSSGNNGSGSGNANNSGNTAGGSPGYTKLQSGAKGDAVKKLQKALQALNYNVSADGSYGPETISAVRRFQEVNGLTVDGIAGAGTQTLLYSGNAKKNPSGGTSSGSGSGSMGSVQGPSGSSVKLLHWFNEVKPSLSNGSTLTVYDPATGLQWKLRVYSRGRHCDSEPITAEDTATMYKAFGNQNTWTPKPVYVKLPSGTWTLATQHNVPHESQSIKNNDFDGHLCVHFLRDMDECKQNDPNYGVTNQNAIRKAWKSLTGITVE